MIEKNNIIFEKVKHLTILERKFIFENNEYEIHIHGFLNKLLWHLDILFNVIITFAVIFYIREKEFTGIAVFILCAIFVIFCFLITDKTEKSIIRRKLFFDNNHCISIQNIKQ